MTLRRFAFMLAACLTFAGKANDMVEHGQVVEAI